MPQVSKISKRDFKTIKTQQKIYLVLDNLRSAYNVGSLFRTADAANVEEIFLCGITPTPGEEKQGNRRVKKTAIGAEKYLKWSYFKNTSSAIQQLKKTWRNNYKLRTNNSSKNLYPNQIITTQFSYSHHFR